MLKKLTGIATAMALAMAIVIVATLIEAPSARAETVALTAADLQSDRGTVLAIDIETRTMVVETINDRDCDRLLPFPLLANQRGASVSRFQRRHIYIPCMAWTVEYTDEFGDWWTELSDTQQDLVAGDGKASLREQAVAAVSFSSVESPIAHRNSCDALHLSFSQPSRSALLSGAPSGQSWRQRAGAIPLRQRDLRHGSGSAGEALALSQTELARSGTVELPVVAANRTADR